MRGLLAIFLLALAGCVPGGDQRRNEVAPANRTAGNNVAPVPVVAPDPRVVGRWADVGASCANPVEIFGNGTFRAVDGSRGHWRYEGDQLTITVGERVYSFRVLSLTRDRIETIDGNGQRGSSVRCP